MAWTQSDLDALETALKAGARVVQFRDRRVEYHSLEEMLKLRAVMKDEVLGDSATTPSVSYAKYSKA